MIPRNWWNIENMADDKQVSATTLMLKDFYNILNKGIIPSENFRGTLLGVTFSALNTNTSVIHGLAFAPQNYFVVGISGDMRIYDGVTLSDKTFINFRCAGTTGAARIFVF